jgi:hypothetical protein
MSWLARFSARSDFRLYDMFHRLLFVKKNHKKAHETKRFRCKSLKKINNFKKLQIVKPIGFISKMG